MLYNFLKTYPSPPILHQHHLLHQENATLTFTDAYGRVAKQLTLYPYFKNRIIYTNDLSEGVYLVTMENEEVRTSKKVVVAH